MIHHSLTQMVNLAVTGQHGLKTLDKLDLELTRIRYLLMVVACRGKMQVLKLFLTLVCLLGGISER
jgi:hypothetical protein